MRHLFVPAMLLALAPAGAVRAAESYDNCSGFITSLPATVTTQGVWCLDRDLSTAITNGEAITLAGNNITLDCNHFKLGGLAGGDGTLAIGIYANLRSNITVRNCNVRGFGSGVMLLGIGQSGHLVEHNRLDGNTVLGVLVEGDGTVIRNNHVVDTGGSTVPIALNTAGISAAGSTDVVDNIIAGVSPGGNLQSGTAYGIRNTGGGHSSVLRNTVKFVLPTETADSYGIDVSGGTLVVVEDNLVMNIAITFVAINCGSVSYNYIRDNTLRTPGTMFTNCKDGGGNVGNFFE